MLWLGIYLPELGLEVVQHSSPWNPHQAIVLVKDQRICLLNPLAREQGIHIGMSLASAYSVVPNLQYHTRDIEAEQQRMQALVATGYRFTPRVCLRPSNSRSDQRTDLPSGVMLLEVAGSLKLFDGMHRLRHSLQRRFQRLGHKIRVGAGHTPNAAIALAKANVSLELPEYPLERDVEKQVLSHLTRVDLVHTELPLAIIERLRNMGINTLGELIELPLHELSKRFDSTCLDYLARMVGELPDPWITEAPVERFHSTLHLLDPIRGKQELHPPMERLLLALSDWLAARYLGVREVEWGFYTFEGNGVEFAVQFALPQSDEDEVHELTLLKLENVQLPEEVMSVSLKALRTEHRSRIAEQAPDLFGNQTIHLGASSALLDRLSTRLGTESLQALQSIDDHRPEHAWSPEFLTGIAPHAIVSCASIKPGTRPIWLFEPPLPVQPKYFKLLNGPERIQGGWWEQAFDRDYFVAKHENGCICWVFRNQKGWFQHGYFA